MRTTLAAVLCLFIGTHVAQAEGAGVLVDSYGDPGTARTYQLMAIQALESAGVRARDLPVLRPGDVLDPAIVVPLAQDAQLDRLFVLSMSPLKDATLLALEERKPTDGATLYRATLLCARDLDAMRTLGRLVKSVLDRRPVDADETVSSVTEAEAQAYAKKPGEYLNGLSVTGGVVAGDMPSTVQLFGFGYHFMYELPHVNFGATTSYSFSEDTSYFDLSIRAHYLFSEGDTSAYLGGGAGFGLVHVEHYNTSTGANFIIDGGVELFRLHSARFLVGAEVMLPAFTLTPHTYSSYDYDTTTTQTFAELYPMAVSLKLGVMF